MLQLAENDTSGVDVKTIRVPPSGLSDMEIIKRIKGGDVNAYGLIMRRYNQRMFRVARSIVINDAEALDCVQEAHIKAYTHLHEFNGPDGFFAWLAQITRNETLMYLRKLKKEVVMSEDELQSLGQSEFEHKADNVMNLPDSCIENKQLQELINSNIDKLPEKFRTVFVLRAIEQLTVKETADILAINQITVKTRYFRAKRLLRGMIQGYLDAAGMKVYEVGGRHCDLIVFNVLSRIKQIQN